MVWYLAINDVDIISAHRWLIIINTFRDTCCFFPNSLYYTYFAYSVHNFEASFVSRFWLRLSRKMTDSTTIFPTDVGREDERVVEEQKIAVKDTELVKVAPIGNYGVGMGTSLWRKHLLIWCHRGFSHMEQSLAEFWWWSWLWYVPPAPGLYVIELSLWTKEILLTYKRGSSVDEYCFWEAHWCLQWVFRSTDNCYRGGIQGGRKRK